MRKRYEFGPSLFVLALKHVGGMRKLAAILREDGEKAAREAIAEAWKKAEAERDEA